MGTHSWSVPPLGLLALFSAATQVSPHSARSAFSRISILSEFSGVSPHSARSPFSRIFPALPPPSFFFFPGVSPQSARTPFSDFSWSIPPLRPAVIFPVCWSIPPLRPPSVSQLPGVSPHSAHRDFPSFLVRRHSMFPKFPGASHLTILQAPYTRSVARTSHNSVSALLAQVHLGVTLPKAPHHSL